VKIDDDLPRSGSGLSRKAKANPERTKAGLEELEAAVDFFEKRLDKMDTTDLEANREN
jgi:hypothetical protein